MSYIACSVLSPPLAPLAPALAPPTLAPTSSSCPPLLQRLILTKLERGLPEMTSAFATASSKLTQAFGDPLTQS